MLLRSVDAETAAALLGQLSTEEATTLREAIRALGAVDPEEQADVAAEFRRERPIASQPASVGVELELSNNEALPSVATVDAAASANVPRRFEFLESASTNTVAAYLAREQAQTIAVVLSHLQPTRAALVLAALPENIQAATMERLACLGDTDSDVVNVIEHELTSWLKKRSVDGEIRSRRRDTVSTILAAADSKTRSAIVANLKSRNVSLAEGMGPQPRERAKFEAKPRDDEYRIVKSMAKRHQLGTQLKSLLPESTLPASVVATKQVQINRLDAPPAPIVPSTPQPVRSAISTIEFDQIEHLDARMFARLLAVADPNVLALALAGSSDSLVERVCDQMPKRIAKEFRRQLRRLGPTRLSDVEQAQQAIAELATEQISQYRDTPKHETASRASA